MGAFSTLSQIGFTLYFCVRFAWEMLRRLFNIIFVSLTARWGKKQFIFVPDADCDAPSISFAGGGMLWTYYLGVAHYIFRNYDHTRIKILVSSAGTFGGVPLALGLDPYAWCTSDWAKCLAHFASRPCGMFFDQAEFYKQLWDEYLPNRVVSHFATRDELINCIVASSCFPLVFVRNMPTTSFGMAFDGGLSNDQPCVSERTITVSCINLKTDLSPKCAHDAKTAASSTITSNSSSNNAAHHYSSAARFSVVDMVSVPRFERVWEIAHAAESDAACCERLASLSEWRAIAKAQ